MIVSDTPAEDSYSSDEEKMNWALFLLLAVLAVSPPAIAVASIFLISTESVLVYFVAIIALAAIYLSKIYLGRVVHPRCGWMLSRGLRILAFAVYIIVLIAVIGVLIDDNMRPGRDIGELIDELVTDMFLFLLPIHGLLVAVFTLLSLTFRAVSRDTAVDIILALLLVVLPLMNIAIFFRGT